MSRHGHIVVTGSNGQLGHALQEQAALARTDEGPEWVFLTRQELDLEQLNGNDIPEALRNHSPRLLINLAAYTDVDRAESDIDKAFAVNATGPGHLAAHCRALNCRIIHISTDYVYGGEGNRPFSETQPIRPLGVYARSKAEGESAVLDQNPDSLIIRTSWLYNGGPHRNFLTTMQRLGRELEEVRVVNDQIGSPTFTGDLANAIVQIGKRLLDSPAVASAGIYNYSNEGTASWYDFAWSIMDSSGLNCRVIPVPTHEFPRPAPRPAFSLMNKAKIRDTFEIEIPHWQDGLRRCLNTSD